MGEYIRLGNGETVKLGTCEDLYYTTLAQLQQAIHDGASKVEGNLAPQEYLDPKNGFRYRFPFPDENIAIGEYEDYERGWTVNVPPRLIGEDHYTVQVHIHPRSAKKYDFNNLTMVVGCPLDPDQGKRPATQRPAPTIAQIRQQKQVDGTIWVVLGCPYCGSIWRLPPDEGTELVAFLRREYGDGSTNLIASEIERGYATKIKDWTGR